VEKFGADPSPPAGGMDAQQAGYTDLRRQLGFARVRAEAGMREADHSVILDREQKSLGVKIGLGEDVLLKQRGSGQQHRTGPFKHLVPKFHQTGRIGVAKRAIMKHSPAP
jgi:hypothetical protein